MRFLLDSSAVIALFKRNETLIERIRLCAPGDVALSAIVAHELYFGAFKGARTDQSNAMIEAMQLPMLEFDREDARESGRLRALLAIAGTPIGPYDVLIAGQALARDLILVTHNLREFARAPGLRVEDWQEGA